MINAKHFKDLIDDEINLINMLLKHNLYLGNFYNPEEKFIELMMVYMKILILIDYLLI